MPVSDYQPRSFAGLIGIAERDITPPVGIHNRNWGAAAHDRAEGVHQPLILQAAAFKSSPDAQPLVLIAMDVVCFFGGPMKRYDGDEWRVRKPVLDALGIDESRLIMSCSHSHATACITTGRDDQPGGELIAPYQAHVTEQAVAAAREAVDNAAPATLTWATGRCSLAAHRDLYDPDLKRYLTGTDFSQTCDDTVLVGRITRDDDQQTIASLVNFACHPTTLAWDNTLLSPDYIGSMRDVVRRHTDAPCLFTQGASGEVGPREGFTGDHGIAERNGRQLGHAVMEAIESMLPPRTKLVYKGVKESGALIAVWQRKSFEPDATCAAAMVDVTLPLKGGRPTVAELRAQVDGEDRVMAERARRKVHVIEAIGDGETCDMPLWCWRLGEALFAAQPCEAYTLWQTAMRQRFADHAVVAINVANASLGVGYICPDDILARETQYQAWQSPFAPGSHDALVAASIEQLQKLVDVAG